jgi:nickel/cobalt transporter (NicO) family protein
MAAVIVRSSPRAFVPLALAVLLHAAPAGAHPMGTLSVSRWTSITARGDRLEILHRVDYAEVPTAAELGAAGLRAPPTGAARDALRARLAARVVAGLRVTADGAPVTPSLDHSVLEALPGEGGLPTFRLDLFLGVALQRPAGAEVAVKFEDGNFMDRVGWHEIVAEAAEGAALVAADVPRQDRTRGLSTFPKDADQAPLHVRSASLRVRLGQPAASQPAATTSEARSGGGPRPGAPGGRQGKAPDRLTALVGRGTLTPGLVVLALVIALGLGAFHALSPGHGKALVAAWLVGSRGTARHAVLLGIVVTVTHTAGVFALGGVTLGLSHWIMPDRLLPWLELASGVMIVVIGAAMMVQRWRNAAPAAAPKPDLERATFRLAGARPGRLAPAHAHDHDHDEAHDHDRGNGHVHSHDLFGAHAHSHAPPPGPLSLRSLVALGVSGGLVPCPSALVVLLSAIAFNRIGLGLGLIVAFSLGLASVLSIIGVLVVRGARLLERVKGFDRWGRLLPVASAVLVTALGVALSLKAVLALGSA